MSLLAADFLILFPQFAAVDPTMLDRYLQTASRRINETYFGSRADDAHGFLTAHLLSVGPTGAAGGGGSGGPIQSITAGNASITYAVAAAAMSTAALGRTVYGQEYLELVFLAGPGATVL